MQLSNTAVTEALNSFFNAVETGGGASALELTTAGGVTLVAFPLPSPAFSVVGSSLLLNGGAIAATASSSGTPQNFRIRNRAGTQIADGLIGATNAELYCQPGTVGIFNIQTLNDIQFRVTGAAIAVAGSVKIA